MYARQAIEKDTRVQSRGNFVVDESMQCLMQNWDDEGKQDWGGVGDSDSGVLPIRNIDGQANIDFASHLM